MPVRGPAALAFTLLAAPLAAQDRPTMPEHADHAAAMPAASNRHAHDDTLVPDTPTLLEGYGNGGFAVTTQVPQAQAFFSNGLELGAAFAHNAAIEAMKEAVRLDPHCAMCLWGEALVAGPTINFGKDAAERKPLYALAKDARELARRSGTERERALTEALVQRYKPGTPARRDRAYARAMEKVQVRWPEDNEIAVLTADAMMVAAFGDYSDPDMALLGRAAPLLEGVLARDPNHTPAIHFYIHASEALAQPAKAEPYADRLEALAPRASHLVHMPAHTWYWLGRYEDAARTNWRAVEIGKENAARLGLPAPDGVWGLPYHAHNVIYGLGGALMAGDAEIGLVLARPLVERAAARENDSPVAQLLAALGYEAVARFDPAGVAALPEPKGAYLKAAWHYARGEAAVARGDTAAVEAERAAIPASLQHMVGVSFAPELMLGIMRAVLAGRLATLRGDYRAAAEAFRAAAELEENDTFNDFTDPPAFWYPVRRDVAAALLAAGDAQGAKAAAEASLKLRMKDPVAEALLARAEAALAAAR
jgi:tetratricopeptide (TPR) repeat protein